ncbi:MAG TPA: hypothetical protein DDW78_10565 [Treponema sp.]|nr:hypothetical protein [Treponema sp.]
MDASNASTATAAAETAGSEPTADFNSQVIAAIEAKKDWYDTTLLPKVQEHYRTHLAYVRSLFDTLVKRSIIQPDPYKHDSKISSIVCPDDTPFGENERAVQMGLRLSAYESMVDFVCNYMKFTVDQLNTIRIKKLLDLNNSFNWGNLSQNSSRVNTRGLAQSFAELRKSGQGMTANMLNDGLDKSADGIEEINKALKGLAEFEREVYKGDVRRNVLLNPQFDKSKMQSGNDLLAEIKRLFAPSMPKRPFTGDLIAEIVAEETAANKAELQQQLMEKLRIEEAEETVRVNTVDTHEIIMLSVRTLGSTAEQYNSVIGKIGTNHDILASESNTFKDKLMRLIRNLFGLEDPPVVYDLLIADHSTNTKRHEKLPYNQFLENLSKRSRYYAALTSRTSPSYQKMDEQPDNVIADFVTKQIRDNGRLHVTLTALDEFFKATVAPSNRTRIKGIKMELTTLKNLLVKANQSRAEYEAYAEEQKQMQQLGIQK